MQWSHYYFVRTIESRFVTTRNMSQPCLPIPRSKRKRGRNDKEESSSEEEDQQGSSFDSIQTMDAAEYLSRVVRQAKNMPDVFVANGGDDESESDNVDQKQRIIPIDGSAASLSYFFSGRTDLTPPPTIQHLPKDPAWIDTTIQNFEKLRSYLEVCKGKGIGGKKTQRIACPPMKNRSGWHVFCVGRDEASGNTDSYFGDDRNNEDEKAENSSPDDDIPAWEKEVPANGHVPSVRLVLQMDQVLVRRVLSHLSHYICEGWSAFSYQRLAWIYALLARLEKPIHRDDAAMLFSLLKALTRSRSQQQVQTDEKKNLAKLNVLILLIGVYFEQGGGIPGVMTVKSS